MFLSVVMVLITLLLSAFKIEVEFYEFILCATFTFVVGLFGFFLKSKNKITIMPKDVYLITILSWFIIAAFASLPFIFIQKINIVDALFESVSALTTTGSTVLTNLDNMSSSILLWRSILQWIGGIGIIAITFCVFPLFKAKNLSKLTSNASYLGENVTEKSYKTTKYIFYIYCFFTVVGILLFKIAQMNWFDAINHALTSISTAGFSTKDNSLSAFSNSAQLVAILLMILGSLPFPLYIFALKKQFNKIIYDEQVLFFILFLCVTSFLLAIWLYASDIYEFVDALRVAAFQVVSIISTTGFVLDNYNSWGSFAFILLLLCMLIGGCSESTSGGIKIFRLQISLILLNKNLKQMLHPNLITQSKYNNNILHEDTINNTFTFCFCFVISISVVAISLSLLGIDSTTSISAAISAICNTGTAFGDIIGPFGTYENIPYTGKIILIIAMILGRIEIISFFIIFTSSFWKS